MGHQALLAAYGSPEIVVDAADFDGTNDNLSRGAGLTGAADTSTFTMVCWLRADTWTLNARIFNAVNSVGGADGGGSTGWPGLNLETSGGNFLRWEMGNSAAGNELDIQNGTNLSTGVWYCSMISLDITNASLRHIYTNDVSDIGTVTTYTSTTFDFTKADHGFCGQPSGVNRFDGCVAQFWFSNTYIDFSIVSNRRKFISASGNPVHLGSDGSLPTGTAPLIYFNLADGEAVANYATNRGSGGNFAITGTLATCATSPSD